MEYRLNLRRANKQDVPRLCNFSPIGLPPNLLAGSAAK
jgi:hypothetical protein